MMSETGQCLMGNGSALSIPGTRTVNNVKQSTCNINNALQRWSFVDAGDGYHWVIQPSGLCLSTSSWFLREWVSTDECRVGSLRGNSQMFQLRYDARGGAVTLSPRNAPDMCLEIGFDSHLNAIGVMLRRCDPTKPQRLYLPLGEFSVSTLNEPVSPST